MTCSMVGGTPNSLFASELSNTVNKLSWKNGTADGEELELSTTTFPQQTSLKGVGNCVVLRSQQVLQHVIVRRFLQ